MEMKRTEPLPLHAQAGEFEIIPWDKSASGEYELHFVRPGCRFNKCVLKIREGEPNNPIFGWDGNRDKPTITPSIGCDNRCGWHGHIIAGVMTPSVQI